MSAGNEHTLEDLAKPPAVLRLRDIDRAALARLLGPFGLELAEVVDDSPIPGSFWGDEEAGLVNGTLHARPDTPIHSILHETSHYICMTPGRRGALHTNAGGDHDEENAVCYLQILLADQLPGMGRKKMMQDMDLWGYSFRLGSAGAWFHRDAADARAWLIHAGLIDENERMLWTLRGS
jgi:hypothetical protein